MSEPTGEQIEDERLKAFLDVVAQIPPTWACLDCRREFENHPDGEPPYATRTRASAEGVRVEIGHVCRACCELPR